MEVLATGYKNRQNSLVYSCPASPCQHVIFFQGDIQVFLNCKTLNPLIWYTYLQDTMANMMDHQAEVSPRRVMEVSRWSEWCLENTCSLLQQKFHDAAVWIIRPCRMLRSLYSCYHHFVESSMTGVPSYSSNHGAILHLHALLTDAVQKEKERGSLKLSIADALSLPIVLSGFSKGCVVLNQVTHELVNVCTDYSTIPSSHEVDSAESDHRDKQQKTTPTTNCGNSSSACVSKPLPLEAAELKVLKEFVSHIKAFYWLDSGHSGEDGAWVTDDNPLRALASLQIPVHIDVTPQQVRDPHRKWIGEEEAEFVVKLRQFGANVTETLHFEHEEKSLEKHFQVLREFKV